LWTYPGDCRTGGFPIDVGPTSRDACSSIDYEWTGAQSGVIGGYLGGLGDDDFQTRENASRDLLNALSRYFTCLGYEQLDTIVYALNEAISGSNDAEVRARLRSIRDQLIQQYDNNPVCGCPFEQSGR
jgi:hypothetical protein